MAPPTPPGWRLLADEEDRGHWDRFAAAVGFRPAVEPADWPGITEHLLGDQPDWAVPVHPDGDYSVFRTPDHTHGTFGRPWERTLCVFGPRPVVRS